MKLKAADVRKMIGKPVEWDNGYDFYRGVYFDHRKGIVEEVKGKNVLISGDWRWLPDLHNFKLVEDKP